MIHTTRPDGYIDYFNHNWLTYLGRSLEDIQGWKWTGVIHPADVEGILERWRASLATGEPFLYETRVRRADGEFRWMLHHKVPLRDEHGKIIKWYGSSIDIEGRKCAEEQLRRSAQELQRSESYLAEGQRLAHLGSWAFDYAGFNYWSPELFLIYGLDPANKAPTVQEYLDCVHPQDRESMANLIKGILAEASSFDVTKRIVRPDGEVRYIRCVGAPVVENQRLTKYVGSAIDVTEQELMTQELHSREAYLTEAQRLSHTGSFGWRPDSGDIVWSDETYRIFEYDRAVKPTIELIVQRVHPEDRVDFLDVIDRASAGTTHFEHACRLLLPDGRVKHVHALAHTLQDASGNCQFVGALMDVTERKRAEEAVRQSEKELRSVIDTIPAIVWSALPDGSNTYVNSRFTEYSGMSAELTAGLGWQAATHPDDLQLHDGKWRASVATGEPHENEVRFRRADGQYRWYLDRGVPLRDQSGNIVKWYGVLTDIEDRKRAEAMLAEEKRILEMVAKGDSLGQILERLCRLVEEQAQGVLASVLLVQNGRLMHGGAPSLPKAYMDAVDGIAIGPTVGSCGTAAYRGEQVIVSDIATDPLWAKYRDAPLSHSLRACWSTPVFSSQGKVIATFAMYYREPRSPSQREQDIIEQITQLAGVAIERKLTQEALRASELNFRRIVDGIPGLVYTLTADGEVEFVNQQILNYTGKTFEELKRWETTDPDLIHPDDVQKVITARRRTLETGQPHTVEHRLRRADGVYRWFDLSRLAQRDSQGHVIRWYVLLSDIHERKRAEETAQKTQTELAHVARVATLGELTASIAHEINQPLGAIVNNAGACLRWLAAQNMDEVRQSIENVIKDGHRASDIISRIRALVKKTPPQKDGLDVNNIVREVITLARAELDVHHVALQLHLSDDRPVVWGDRIQIQQVLLNLIINATEAMGGAEGSRTLRISTISYDERHVLVTVQDSGPGLDPTQLNRLFEAFYSTKPGGLGMGLAISRSIIEAHDGRLWATTNEDRGATFHFTLPIGEERSA